MNKAFLCLFLCTLLGTQGLYAQQTVTFKTTHPYRFELDDTWSLNIYSSQEVEVVLSAEIKKENYGQVVALTSRPMVLKKGMNLLSRHVAATAFYQFYPSGIADYYTANRTLPSGSYTLCIKISCFQPDCSGQGPGFIGSDVNYCNNFQLQVPTPLLLNTPANAAVISDNTPLLTWIPPSPVSPEVTYTLRLVQLQEGQGRLDAIQRNVPLVEAEWLKNIQLNYPMDLPPLEYGSSYAWEVRAVAFREEVAKSEVWEFTLKEDTLIKKEEVFDYIKIWEAGNSVLPIRNFLKLDHIEKQDKESMLHIRIVDEKKNTRATFEQPTVFGENLVVLDLRGIGLKSGESYKAIVRTAQGKEYVIAFTFHFSY